MKVSIDIFDRSSLQPVRHKIGGTNYDGYYLPCDKSRSFIERANYHYFSACYGALDCVFEFGDKLFIASDIPENTEQLVALFSDIRCADDGECLGESYYNALVEIACVDFLYENVQEFVDALALPSSIEEMLFGDEGIFSPKDCVSEMNNIIREHNFVWDIDENSVWINSDAIAEHSRWQKFDKFLPVSALDILQEKVFSAVVETEYKNELLVQIHSDLENVISGNTVTEAFYA